MHLLACQNHSAFIVMAERAAARSEHIAATVAPAMTDPSVPPAAASHQEPLHIGSTEAQSPASAAGARLVADSSTDAVVDAVSRRPAGMEAPDLGAGAETPQATPLDAVGADTEPRATSSESAAVSRHAEPADSDSEAAVLREEPEGALPPALSRPAETAGFAEGDGDDTATERGDSDDEEEEGSDEEVRLRACAAHAARAAEHRPPPAPTAKHVTPACKGRAAAEASAIFMRSKRMGTSTRCPHQGRHALNVSWGHADACISSVPCSAWVCRCSPVSII